MLLLALTALARAEDCVDGVDDDEGGAADCADPDCALALYGAAPVDIIAIDDEYAYDIADLDGDGDDDVAITRFYAEDLRVLLNTAGAFTVAQTLAVEGGGPVRAADLDGDGDLDLVQGTVGLYFGTGSYVWAYENLGGGAFAPGVVLAYLQGQDITDVDFADLDADGDAEVLVGTGSLHWLETVTPFGPATVHALEVASSDVVTADLDADGDQDILSTSPVALSTYWFQNTGAGAPGPLQLLGSGVAAHVDAGDLDLDGDVDVVTGDWVPDGDDISVFDGLGGGLFAASTVLSSPANLMQVSVLDLDADGRDDVVSYEGTSDDAAWYRGLGAAGLRSERPTLASFASGLSFALDSRMLQVGDADSGAPDLFGVHDQTLVYWPGTGCTVQDQDGDGLANLDEGDLHGTDPFLADTDGDTVDDGQELANGTDPLVADPIPEGTGDDADADADADSDSDFDGDADSDADADAGTSGGGKGCAHTPSVPFSLLIPLLGLIRRRARGQGARLAGR